MRRAAFLYLALIFLSGCALPKIVILDDPLTPEEHLNLGVAYEKQGELDAAIKEYNLAAKKLPLAYLYLGNAHFLKNEYDDAEGYYRKAIRKVPENADAHNNLAWLIYTKHLNDFAGGRAPFDEAEALAEKAIELDPARAETYRDTLEKIRIKRP